MTSTPLKKIGFSREDHKLVLWSLGLLYRRPKAFCESLGKLSAKEVIFFYLKIWLHFLPYLIMLAILCRIILLGVLRLETVKELTSVSDILFFHVKLIAIGIATGIAIGTPLGIVRGIATGIATGIALGIALGTTFEIALGTTLGITLGITSGIFFGTVEVTSRGIPFVAGGIFLGIATGIVSGIFFRIAIRIGLAFPSGIAFGIAAGIAMTIGVLRTYYYPISLFFVWPKAVGKWYPFHPVAWDNLCSIPFPRLDRLLVSYAEHSGAVGLQEIERLISSYPSQRMHALRAKVILLARKAGSEKDLSQLTKIVSQLPQGEKGFLKETQSIQEKVTEIGNLQILINTINRVFLRELYIKLLREKIENFRHQIGGFQEPLVSEFRKAADNWLKIAQQQLEEVIAVTKKEPTPQVFRAGDPVNRDTEAFVPRYAVIGNLEKQVMLSTGCPGLVVYARRRMGKSTLLRNLEGFLPKNIIPVLFSMQNPEVSTSLEYLIQKITQDIEKVLRGKELVNKIYSDLPGFFNYLSDCNQWLEKNTKRILLSIDEYENIDLKIGQHVFPEDLLASIRESIQSHRYITWIFAGSHEIDELKHARWTSYLVSARTIEIPLFTLDETNLLLTEPLKHSDLCKDNIKRPSFDQKFWGEGGIEHVHREAGGWPHLVQLIAETIVDLMNDEDLRHVNEQLMECALDKAIVSGHNVLYELMRGECTLPGEWEYLSAFRQKDLQPPPEDEAVYNSLRRRLLVEEERGLWRLRVPLMERWLRKRG